MKPPNELIRKILELQLAQLKYEMNNFRNDGWVQQGYREKYEEALTKYIKMLPLLQVEKDK
jgi:hypothetical protein